MAAIVKCPASLTVWLLAVVVFSALGGCQDRAVVPLKSARDQQVAAEVVEFLKQELAALPESSEVVQRYGKFEALESTSAVRAAPSRPTFGETSFPACIVISAIAGSIASPKLSWLKSSLGNQVRRLSW